MADDRTIEHMISRARAQWLNTAVVNAGAKIALLPAALTVLIALLLISGNWAAQTGIIILSIVGLLACLSVLVAVRIVFAKSRSNGAPDWALLLDRKVNGHDCIPTWLEANDEFKPAIAAQVVSNPTVKLGLSRNWGGLFLVLMLLSLPFAFLKWQETAKHQEPQVISEDEKEPPPDEEPATPPNNPTAGTSDGSVTDTEEGDNEGSSAPNSDSKNEGDGTEAPKPEASDGAGEPEKENPEGGKAPAEPEPQGKDDDSGDNKGRPLPKSPEAEEPKEVDLSRITPETRDGDTVKRQNTRLASDPDGDKNDNLRLRPSPTDRAGERATPRTAMTNKERSTVTKILKSRSE